MADLPEHIAFRGRVTSGLTHWSWPFGRLLLDREWAVVRAPGVRISIPRRLVIRVDVVRGVVGSGVRFATASGTFDRVSFRQVSPTRLLTALGALGWFDDEPVEPA